MSQPEFMFKKRAVYTGLESFLTNAQLMQAMVLWENKYANEPKFAMRKFVADLCKRNGQTLAQAEVLGKLVRTMALPEEKLLPDPSPEIESYKKHYRVQAKVERRSPEVEVFQLLLSGLLDGLRPSIRESVIRYAIDGLHAMDISTGLRRELVFWLKGESTIIYMPVVDVHQLRGTINMFYVAICEYIGPIKADQLLAQEVRRLSDNKEERVQSLINKLI